LCEVCFIKKSTERLNKAQAKEEKKVATRNAKMKKDGFTHVVTAWVHRGGDDVCADIYFKGEPTSADIQRQLKKSPVKDDYTVKLL
jgi:hypothetical protein